MARRGELGQRVYRWGGEGFGNYSNRHANEERLARKRETARLARRRRLRRERDLDLLLRLCAPQWVEWRLKARGANGK